MFQLDYFICCNYLNSGGVFQFGQQCKLLHMCTRRYLSVESYESARGDNNKDKFKVNLTSDHLDPKTVFRLHPVDRVCVFFVFICITRSRMIVFYVKFGCMNFQILYRYEEKYHLYYVSPR
jgi:hypothetical protein